jgi:hypothetical protein
MNKLEKLLIILLIIQTAGFGAYQFYQKKTAKDKSFYMMIVPREYWASLNSYEANMLNQTLFRYSKQKSSMERSSHVCVLE